MPRFTAALLRVIPLLSVVLGLSACGGPGRGAVQAPIQPVSAAPAPSSGWKQGPHQRTHQVKAGETLHTLAFEKGVDINDLVAWNGLADKVHIRAGQTLLIEPPTAPIGEAGMSEGASGRSSADRASPKMAAVARKVPVEVASGWVWPVKGSVVRGFDPRKGSKGLDIVASEGTLVNAAAAGEVVYAGNGLRGYGNLIILKHNVTTLSAYAHQSRLLVSEGQQVLRGQPIGEVGSVDADRIKLHFQIREFGKPIDPRIYLPKV